MRNRLVFGAAGVVAITFPPLQKFRRSPNVRPSAVHPAAPRCATSEPVLHRDPALRAPTSVRLDSARQRKRVCGSAGNQKFHLQTETPECVDNRSLDYVHRATGLAIPSAPNASFQNG